MVKHCKQERGLNLTSNLQKLYVTFSIKEIWKCFLMLMFQFGESNSPQQGSALTFTYESETQKLS